MAEPHQHDERYGRKHGKQRPRRHERENGLRRCRLRCLRHRRCCRCRRVERRTSRWRPRDRPNAPRSGSRSRRWQRSADRWRCRLGRRGSRRAQREVDGEGRRPVEHLPRSSAVRSGLVSPRKHPRLNSGDDLLRRQWADNRTVKSTDVPSGRHLRDRRTVCGERARRHSGRRGQSRRPTESANLGVEVERLSATLALPSTGA